MSNPAIQYRLQDSILLFLFFISGVPALTYQVIWQKLLFTVFGVDLQSVAIIVSTFMLGLGLGALLGGQIGDRSKDKQVLFFVLIELGIGLFGLISYSLIRYIGGVFIQSPQFLIGMVNFLLLLFPAMLMGATLPILVAYLFQRTNNVGISIGKLYFYNTCGASLGGFLAGFIFLVNFSYSTSLYIAAALNFIVAFLAFLFVYKKSVP